jgi:hypothetical protein
VKILYAWVNYAWTASVVLQAVVCGILILRGHFRKLPVFTAYVVLNLCQAAFLYAVYGYYGRASHIAYQSAWWSEAVTLLARLFATLELLHIALISYRGIWGLAWRVLAGTSVVTLFCVELASRGNADWALMEADRGYHLIFAVALTACLLLVRYYAIQIATVYKLLLAGFCFYSCITILINTVLQSWLYIRFAQFESIWQTITIFSYLAMMALWAVALARPLPVPAKQQAMLPGSVYQRIAPEINYQLQAINKQLMKFWKIKEHES